MTVQVATRTAYDVAAHGHRPRDADAHARGPRRAARRRGARTTGVVVAITPTYSGCPAMATMRDDLVHRLRDAGYADVRVRVELQPAWSSDWITERGRAGAGRPRHLAARPGHPRGRPGRADPDADPARDRLPALRLGRRRADLGVRRDRLQGALPLRRLPRAVRAREGDLSVAAPALPHPHGRRRRAAHRRRRRGHLRRARRARRRLRLRGRPVPRPPPRTSTAASTGASTRSAPRSARRPRIGVREIPDGLFSRWLVEEVRPGTEVEVQTPSGTFCADPALPRAAATCASRRAPASRRCSRSPAPRSRRRSDRRRGDPALRQPHQRVGDVRRGARRPQEPLRPAASGGARAVPRAARRRAVLRPARRRPAASAARGAGPDRARSTTSGCAARSR